VLIVLIDRWIAPGIRPAEHDFTHRIVVRQHADDDLAIEQVPDVRRGPDADCRKSIDLIGAADICDYRPSCSCEICSHCRSHATKADETYFAQNESATGLRETSALTWRSASGSKGRTDFVLGHRSSWPPAAAPQDAYRARIADYINRLISVRRDSGIDWAHSPVAASWLL
jgi:hypothetical protein